MRARLTSLLGLAALLHVNIWQIFNSAVFNTTVMSLTVHFYSEKDVIFGNIKLGFYFQCIAAPQFVAFTVGFGFQAIDVDPTDQEQIL